MAGFSVTKGVFFHFADASSLAFLARVDSTMYSKIALLRKHLAKEDTSTPRSARFAGLLFLKPKRGRSEERGWVGN